MKKNLMFLLHVILCFTFVSLSVSTVWMLSSCKDDDNKIENSDTPEDPDDPEDPIIVPPDVTDDPIMLSGIVLNEKGEAVDGATVTCGNEKTICNYDGTYIFYNAPIINGRASITISKAGYFEATRSAKKNGNSLILNASLQSKTNTNLPAASTTFNVADGATLSVSDPGISIPATITIPKNGIVDAQSGAEYYGQVVMETYFLSTDNEDFTEIMPGGDMAAIDDRGNEVILYSYGMMNVKLTDGADYKLQIKSGEKATVTFPIAESQKATAPASMPLWSFNEYEGIWVEEGVATKSADGTYYEGTVTHFSWVNLDYPSARATVKGTVKDSEGKPVSCVKVTIEQVCTYTNEDGAYSAYVPVNTPINVSIKAKDYFDETIASKSVPELNAGEEKVVNFTVPTMPKVTGIVTSCTSTSGEEAIVMLTYSDNSETKTLSSVTTDGEFSIAIPKTVTYIELSAYRANNKGSIYKNVNAGRSVDVGTIQICTPITTKENTIQISGKTYTFDGYNSGFIIKEPKWDETEEGESEMYMLEITLNSKAVDSTHFSEPIYLASISGMNIYSTGSYHFNMYDNQNSTSPQPYLYVKIADKSYSIIEGTLNINKFESAGGLIEGVFSGKLMSADTESITQIDYEDFKLEFSVMRIPDIDHNNY